MTRTTVRSSKPKVNEISTLLHQAALTGRVGTAKALLKRGAWVDAKADGGRTPLHQAARSGHVRVAKVLLSQAAQVDAKTDGGRTPLHEAARSGHVDVAKVLLSQGAQANLRTEDGWTPLHVVAGGEHTPIVKGLCAADVHSDAWDLEGCNVLHPAAKARTPEIMESPFNAGAPNRAYDKNRRAILQQEVSARHADVAQALLTAGAHIDSLEDNGWTPLYTAVRSGNIGVGKALIAAGADGRTLLHEAAAEGHAEIARGLLAAGVLIDAPRKDGPLYEAVWRGHSDVAQVLLDAGAKGDIQNMEYFCSSIDDRESMVDVVGFGYGILPPLHNFQQKGVKNIHDLLLARNNAPRRGILSLPTGSGKTRITVQALVEAIRARLLKGDILWVADRGELCEQAVEAWQLVWASEGELARTIRVLRMWGSRRPVPRPHSKRNVIVASIQTLNARFARDHRFLEDFNVNVVVIDEAHRSTASSYTQVLKHLGVTRNRGYRDGEPYLIGLTATPYRGSNEAETRRLRSRYENRRLDHGIFPTQDSDKVIGFLQSEGILAKVDHETVAGGTFTLSPNERAEAERNPWLPQSVEKRIARDPDRTQRIVDAYFFKVNSDWPTLIFATSVAHSEELADLLSAQGINSKAVSAKTNRLVRNRIVQEFRSGDVKVLINYGIFREGFDAPKTRAVIVARPVYSPNLYFQMIGRGLRGIKNGGNKRCLVLNVKDNIHNYGNHLAFTELDWLWRT